nr:MAG TPA: hypothetical protein [Caudoviricetes sp.]
MVGCCRWAAAYTTLPIYKMKADVHHASRLSNVINTMNYIK